jgi:Meckel syndrome type 1 protein
VAPAAMVAGAGPATTRAMAAPEAPATTRAMGAPAAPAEPVTLVDTEAQVATAVQADPAATAAQADPAGTEAMADPADTGGPVATVGTGDPADPADPMATAGTAATATRPRQAARRPIGEPTPVELYHGNAAQDLTPPGDATMSISRSPVGVTQRCANTLPPYEGHR